MAEVRKNEPKIDADEVLAGIVEWVSIESPSHDAKSVNKVVDHVEGQFRDLGLKLERIPGRDGFGDILECKTPPEWSTGEGKGILERQVEVSGAEEIVDTRRIFVSYSGCLARYAGRIPGLGEDETGR